MTETHILVDFENVQPSAADIALVRGDALRLAIFRGPGQMKYAADVAEAWQPLGAHVSFIRCAKAGRNAVDMHIAFYLGELVAAHAGNGGRRARFVIVSRDTDFDPLLMHIRSQGFDASRVASIKAALGGAEPKTERARGARAAPAAEPAKPASPKAPAAAKKSAAKKAVAKKAPARKTASAGAAKKEPKAAAANAAPAPADARTRVIDSLRRMGDKRPAKRPGLERHIESHLGRNLAPGALEALLQQLERENVLVFDGTKVQYRLPKDRK
jgi:hypothetical protein